MARVRFAPCPSSPNCVSTKAPTDDTEHRAEPIAFSGDADAAMAAVLGALEGLKRTTIAERDDRYVRAVVSSAVFRFKDDVEFEVDADAQQIHYRSASRVGHSDLGVNRKRTDGLRATIADQLA